MAWIRKDKLRKGKMLDDLRKLSAEELYVLIHVFFWEVDHDCGKRDDLAYAMEQIQMKLKSYIYYDSIDLKD